MEEPEFFGIQEALEDNYGRSHAEYFLLYVEEIGEEWANDEDFEGRFQGEYTSSGCESAKAEYAYHFYNEHDDFPKRFDNIRRRGGVH